MFAFVLFLYRFASSHEKHSIIVWLRHRRLLFLRIVIDEKTPSPFRCYIWSEVRQYFEIVQITLSDLDSSVFCLCLWIMICRHVHAACITYIHDVKWLARWFCAICCIYFNDEWFFVCFDTNRKISSRLRFDALCLRLGSSWKLGEYLFSSFVPLIEVACITPIADNAPNWNTKWERKKSKWTKKKMN